MRFKTVDVQYRDCINNVLFLIKMFRRLTIMSPSRIKIQFDNQKSDSKLIDIEIETRVNVMSYTIVLKLCYN